jgi:glucose-1-phosphatase
MKKTMFFDLGNVVLYFSHEKMCRQIARYCETDEQTVHDTLFQKRWNEKYEVGDIDSWALFHHFAPQGRRQEKSLAGLLEAMSDIFTPNESIVPIIKELKKNEVSLYILSNTCEAHFSYAFTHYPILHLFDGFILSYEIKARKPDPKIYEFALHHADCQKEHCFYTDDIPEYIDGARQVGIDAEPYMSSDLLLEHLKKREFLPNNH